MKTSVLWSIAVVTSCLGACSSSPQPSTECAPGTLHCQCNAGTCETGIACVADACAIAIHRCGDGVTDPGEECDDGASNAYTGTFLPTCRLNVCGYGFQRLTGPNPEARDDFNIVTATTCPPGVPTCTAFNSDCAAILHLTGT